MVADMMNWDCQFNRRLVGPGAFGRALLENVLAFKNDLRDGLLGSVRERERGIFTPSLGGISPAFP